MRAKTIVKHVLEVTASNIVTIISGIVVGFILPKIISVEGYGYYKTFTLYSTYLGLFSLGIIDGIVLDYGGVDYKNMERPVFRSYFKWYLFIHLFFAALVALISVFSSKEDTAFILLSLAVNLLAVNISGYFQNLSQITQRFKEYSLRKILQSVFNILIVFWMFLLYRRQGEVPYNVYIVALLAVNTALSIWYVYTYRDIVFGKSNGLVPVKQDILLFIKKGFPLLFANLSSTLILTLDRQFVNILFDKETYAIYAFAYSMLALVTVATSAIATVLYPALKRTSELRMKQYFPLIVSGVLVGVYFIEIVYYPLKWIVLWFLPKYTDSLVIFRIIFPGLGISSVITVVMHNYYKALGLSTSFFTKSIVTLLFSAAANMVAYLLFRTTISISVASIITMFLWYIYVEMYFEKNYGYNGKKNLLYIIVMVFAFYISTALSNDFIGIALYIVLFVSFTFILFKNGIKRVLKILKRNNS